MTTFAEARAFLLKHRTDYATARADFRWPDPCPYNWALDWFDAELGHALDSRDRPALWIVSPSERDEIMLTFSSSRAVRTNWRTTYATSA